MVTHLTYVGLLSITSRCSFWLIQKDKNTNTKWNSIEMGLQPDKTELQIDCVGTSMNVNNKLTNNLERRLNCDKQFFFFFFLFSFFWVLFLLLKLSSWCMWFTHKSTLFATFFSESRAAAYNQLRTPVWQSFEKISVMLVIKQIICAA